MTMPDWLADHLSAAATPRAATEGLLFHGTIEPFDTPLCASDWERLRWFAEAPEIAQSYCAESGVEASAHFARYNLHERFVPHGSFEDTVFAEMGFDVAAMDATRDHTGRMDSYRLLENHPSRQDAKAFLEGMGYVFADESAWIKVRSRADRSEEIMPAAWCTPGRLFVVERPTGLRLFDIASTEDGGLTGRQWMRTDIFEKVLASGLWDGVVIDDVHQTKCTGTFGHRSIGLFQKTIAKSRMHVVACVHADPYDIWKGRDGATTPEFDALFLSAKPHAIALAA